MQASITELSHGITQIDAEYIQPGVAVVYIMVQNGKAAIIETGTVFTAPRIMELLYNNGLSAEDVQYVIPTHVHLDHAGGAGELMQLCEQAKLVIHPYGARHMIDPSKLIAGTIAVYGEEKYQRVYGEIKPIRQDRVIEAHDNFQIDFNGRQLTFLDTPGHARHHFCIIDSASNGIFTGDTFGLCYPQLNTPQGPFALATTTPVQFDPDALINSIDRLISFRPDYMYLTHFGRIEPTASIIQQLKDSIHAYVDIALAEKNVREGREQRIAARIMDYLHKTIRQMQSTLDDETIRVTLQNDAQLNAQGLEVWLQRQE